MGESLEGWLTVAEAAALAGVSAAAIRKRIRAGRLAARRVGPNYLVTRASLEAYERRRAGRPKRQE
jgi:excisionase family DNA binding protein